MRRHVGGTDDVAVAPAAAQGDDVRAIARDAYVFGYPLVLMSVTKRIATAASSPGQFVHMLSGPTPPFRIVVAPNGDTRYSSAWVDLSAEPQVLHVPDAGGRYFVAQVMDAWTDVILDPTPRIPNSAPGNYVLVGPNWNGGAGPGQRLVRSSTNDVWVLARTRALPGDPPEAITAIQLQYTVTPLSRFGDASYEPPRGVLREPNVPTGPTPPSLVAAMAPDVFFAALGAALAKNPPRANDRAIVERLARIGVVPGRAFDATALAAAQRAQLDDGVRDARALLDRYDAPAVPHVNGWRWTANTGRFGTDYLYRAFIAQTLLAANLPEDAVYPETSVDANGAPLTGARRYTLHFGAAQLPPARAFWSLTLYSPDHYWCRMRSTATRCATRTSSATRTARSTWRSSTTRPPAIRPTGCRRRPARSSSRCACTGRTPAGLDGTYRIPAIQPR